MFMRSIDLLRKLVNADQVNGYTPKKTKLAIAAFAYTLLAFIAAMKDL